MKLKRHLTFTSVLVCGLAALVLVPGASAQTKQPKPKSNDEIKAIQAMFNATTPDDQIAAANALIEKFADTEFKSLALKTIAADYQRKGDFPKAVAYGERALEADPKNYEAMLVLATEYAMNTKDSDFDKEDKLKNADKYANDAITTIAAAEKPQPQIPDDQWNAAKKDWTATAHEALGQVQVIRKKPEAAIVEFKTSVDTAATPDATTYVRLAQADNMAGKYDDAIAAAEKAMSIPTASSNVKQVAQAERARAVTIKNKAAGNAPSPSSPAPTTPPAAPTPQN